MKRVFTVTLLLMSHSLVWAALTPVQLKCENRLDPLGVDLAAPHLSWNLISDSRGVRQSAYQVLVASSTKQLEQNRGNLWDSGQVKSNRSLLVAYGGKPLQSAQQVWWKVRVWDGVGKVSSWSAPNQWTMGILTPGDWKARWIGAPDSGGTPANRKSIGYHAGETAVQTDVKWIQVDLGKAQNIERVNFP